MTESDGSAIKYLATVPDDLLLETIRTLYKYFPNGLVAGGAARDYMTYAPVKDVDFWLPRDYLTPDMLRKFAEETGAKFVCLFNAADYGMDLSEPRINSIYQFILNGVRIDVLETVFATVEESVITFTDNFSMATATELDGDILFGWVDYAEDRPGDGPDVVRLMEVPPPKELRFEERLLTGSRGIERRLKVKLKWSIWQDHMCKTRHA